MDITFIGYQLNNLSKFNVIIGKNGCGKSSLLRSMDLNYRNTRPLPNLGFIKYISPERGGALTSDSSILDALQSNPTWGAETKRRNRVENFRQISVAEFRRLETLVLRNIESDRALRDTAYSFNETINSLNTLLENIKLVRDNSSGFSISDNIGSVRNGGSDNLSSGESELVSLGIEILSFFYQAKQPENIDKECILLLDEPDVHLHPDLQNRLANLICSSATPNSLVIFATHSTAFLGSLDLDNTSVCFMKAADSNLRFNRVDEILEKVLPIFGAHPLSNIFNNNPILLVEGEDDERIWQQAIRSSRGKLKFWPCVAGDIQSLDSYEDMTENLISSVYDNACAYSLRDGDGVDQELEDKNFVTRLRLNCRASENLLLTDDVLSALGTSWNIMKVQISNWLEKNGQHTRFQDMSEFSKNFDRQNANLKGIRLILMDLANSNKPWEVVIGQAIANLNTNSQNNSGSLRDFLGNKTCSKLLKISH